MSSLRECQPGIAVAICLLLAACDNVGQYAVLECKERSLGSGNCLKGEYICYAPMVLKSDGKSRPACYMPEPRP